MSNQLICPKCRTPVYFRAGDAFVACPRCGAAFRLHPRSDARPVLMPPVGRGEEDWLTVPTDTVIANRPLLQCYIPKGWQYQCGLVGDRFDLVGNPFVMSVTFAAPDNSAQIVFVGESFYRHIDYTPQTAMLQNRLDDLTVSRTPSFFRLKTLMQAGGYCDAIAQSFGLQALSVTDEKKPDDAELRLQSETVQDYLQHGFLNAAADWAGKTYQGRSQYGQTLKIYAETRVIQLMKLSTVPTMQMMPAGGMFGMRMMPQMVNQQRQDVFWDTPYEFSLLATEEAFDAAFAELQRIRQSVKLLPGMEQARAAALSLANNTVMNIAQAQSASFDRRSRIIADTNAYTSDIQHQIISDNAASHNRTANRYSEMLRDVNTYYGSDGVVEASTRFDHVYQNTQYPDLYAAQEGDALQFGVDFEELEQTDGDYSL